MKIGKITIRNYRSIDHLELEFPSFYSSICGRNNAGKTNVIKAINAVLGPDDEEPFEVVERINFKRDFPVWKTKDQKSAKIEICLQLLLSPVADTGLFKFVTTFLGIANTEGDLHLEVALELGTEAAEIATKLSLDGAVIDDAFKAKEVVKKIRTSKTVFFHNSASPEGGYYRRFRPALTGEYSPEDRQRLENAKKKMNRVLEGLAKRHSKELTDLLGRLEEKYKVGLTYPTIDPEYFPFDLSLRERSRNIPLDDWGSGTRNRTLILNTLMQARRICERGADTDRITPVIVIEEPESFLHPSAQAEFGRVLQELAKEFGVQVIATTHSPYMLSFDIPDSNILLSRRQERANVFETGRVETVGERWMEPFGSVLGIDNTQFEPWKQLFFNRANNILLVEGDTDKSYFELLRDERHGKNALRFQGEIFPYGGSGSLANPILLKFIKNRFNLLFVTYDLDVESDVLRTLTGVGLLRGKQFSPVGLDEAGKRNIEGLLPERVTSAVFGKYPNLVQQAFGDSKDKKEAKGKLKQLLLEQFKSESTPGEEFYKNFYPLVRLVNRALNGDP